MTTNASHSTLIVDGRPWLPGEARTVGGKLYARCLDCGSIGRVNKPLLGSLHICLPDDERSGQLPPGHRPPPQPSPAISPSTP